MGRLRLSVAVAGALLALAACGPKSSAPSAPTHPASSPADVDGARIQNADSEPGNWMSYGRTYNEQRFSPLDQINDKNAGQLGLAWFSDLDTHRGQEATPIVVDGVMYVSTAWSKVKAFDAKTGKPLWSFDPKVPGEWAARACCDVINRGVAVWKGKVYVGTIDGRLIALNAADGHVLWDINTIDKTKPYTITGAPRVIKGKVLIGNGGAEFGVRGYVTAYDADSGRQIWRFYTVPGQPGKPDGAASDDILAKAAASTWNGQWWKLGGGGTVWDAIVYDPDLDLLYIGVGNGSPWNQGYRSPGGGDNLFLSSIVALKPDTGKYVWHYQETPGEEWDYTATQPIILADISIDGQPRKVLMQAPKSGYFYVIDRTNGKLISAKPYAGLNWATGVDLKTGRPVENPDARYDKTGKLWQGLPGPFGDHDWQPMAFSPKTGLVYIPAQEMGYPYINEANFKAKPMGVNMGIDFAANSMPSDPKVRVASLAAEKGWLSAYDPATQKEVWRVQHKGAWNGGVLATAGNLVLQGDATGRVSVYTADAGKLLWSTDAQTGVIAPPMTYTVGGEQYIAVLAGWGGTYPLVPGIMSQKSGNLRNVSRLLVFKLNGKAALPPLAPEPVKVLNPPPETASPAVVDRGFRLYSRFCTSCHGDAVVSGGITPDLRYSQLLGSESFFDVVLHGAYRVNGMASFASVLSKPDATAIRAYIIHRAHETQQQKARGEPWTG